MQLGLGPDHIVLDGDPAPPLPKGHSPHPIFSPYLLRPNGCMDEDATWHGDRPQPRRLCVTWRPRSILPKKGDRAPSPIFGAFLLWPNGCMHQDATPTWYGGRPQPRGLCVRWGPSPLNFRPMFIIAIVISLEHCTMHSRLVCSSSSSSFSILCILFLEKFNRTQSVSLCTVAPHSADA